MSHEFDFGLFRHCIVKVYKKKSNDDNFKTVSQEKIEKMTTNL